MATLGRGLKGKSTQWEVKNHVKEVADLLILLKGVLDVYNAPGKNSLRLEVWAQKRVPWASILHLFNRLPHLSPPHA